MLTTDMDKIVVRGSVFAFSRYTSGLKHFRSFIWHPVVVAAY